MSFYRSLRFCNVRAFSLRSSASKTALENRNSSTVLLAPTADEVEKLVEFVNNSKHLIAITGAGISTASGIPDYRGPNGSYKLGHKPMNYIDFMLNESSRKRFWARSMFGWQSVSQATPNPAHIAMAQFESMGEWTRYGVKHALM